MISAILASKRIKKETVAQLSKASQVKFANGLGTFLTIVYLIDVSSTLTHTKDETMIPAIKLGQYAFVNAFGEIYRVSDYYTGSCGATVYRCERNN